MSAFEPEAYVASLTHRPGVYRMLDARGRVIYVGKARDLKRRVSSYFSGKATDAKTMALVRLVAGIEITVTRTEAEALLLEYNQIKEHRPRYNVLLRDDKSYPYIRLTTDHDFPRISFYRGARPKSGQVFGPYPSAGAVRATVNLLQKLFRLRGCEDSMFSNRSRPCLQYQIGRCSAPCVGLIDADQYARDVDDALLFLKGQGKAVIDVISARMQQASDEQKYELAARYRDQLVQLQSTYAEQLVSRSRGDFDAVALRRDGDSICIAVLFFRGGRLLGSRNHFPQHAGEAGDDDVMRAFLLQYYGGRPAPEEILLDRAVEDAGLLATMFGDLAGHRVGLKWRLRGDRARWVEMAATNASEGARQRSRSRESLVRQMAELQIALGLDEPPGRIECFDISHTSGASTVASCVVFTREGPLKSSYRRFNITGVDPGDDYGAMREVIFRRFRNVSDPELLPDLILIDGGKGQLGAAQQVIDEIGVSGLTLIGVAKGAGRKPGRERLFLVGRSAPIQLPPDSAASHIIQQVRDEAHRFAVAGHRGRRQKQARRSVLEEISGLGPKRRQALLRHFGGLQAVARAGVDELARVHGISRELAENIYQRFHSD